ncbi:MAG: zinc dependent phospholipase C family protein [Clostridia bacterium]
MQRRNLHEDSGSQDTCRITESRIIRKDGYIPEIYKKAFIIGSIEPDKNLLTYLHGFLGGRKLHGHDYEKYLPVMKRLYDMLSEKKVFGLKDYYRLGKLLHDTADAFTYPHNSIFTGSLAVEHWRQYMKESSMKILCCCK